MNIDQFWTTMESAAGAGRGDQERMLTALKKSLSALPAAEIASFQERMDEVMDGSYSWELWAAGYIMNGGCSDDGFDYFRAWLMAQGRATFEAAAKDAETLATAKLSYGELGEYSFESLLYAALYAYEEKTGKEMPRGESRRPEEPTGKEWEEEGDELEKRWPNLWKACEELYE